VTDRQLSARSSQFASGRGGSLVTQGLPFPSQFWQATPYSIGLRSVSLPPRRTNSLSCDATNRTTSRSARPVRDGARRHRLQERWVILCSPTSTTSAGAVLQGRCPSAGRGVGDVAGRCEASRGSICRAGRDRWEQGSPRQGSFLARTPSSLQARVPNRGSPPVSPKAARGGRPHRAERGDMGSLARLVEPRRMTRCMRSSALC
jgi:hypothetical protein